MNIVIENENLNSYLDQITTEKHVLMVDDLARSLNFGQSILSQLENVSTSTASCGKEALNYIKNEQPDLVFMDLYMDSMNGDECCREIKQLCGSELPVILMTHGNSVSDIERCWASGCDGIILKPINPHMLIATTKRLLELNLVNLDQLRCPARITIRHGFDLKKTLADYSVDLSTGGVFLATPMVLPVNTQFAIEICLPNRSQPIRCIARVAWVNDPKKLSKAEMPPGMGLQFIDMALSSVEAIRAYLRSGNLVPSW